MDACLKFSKSLLFAALLFYLSEECEETLTSPEIRKNTAVFPSKGLQIGTKDCDSTSSCSFPWVFCDNGTCQCSNKTAHGSIQCNFNRSLTITSCFCATFDEREAETEVGSCVYNCGNPHNATIINGRSFAIPTNPAKLNYYMCEQIFNRTGTLCSKCKYDSQFPLVYSFDMNCVECPNGGANWWKFVFAAFMPLTIFYFIILFFQINITSSSLYGIVLYAQSVCMPVMVRVSLITVMNLPKAHTAVRYIGIIYGIWNLDFFRSLNLGICLGTNTLQTISLDIVVGIYPLLLMIVSYALIELHDRNFKPLVMIWRPFRTIFSLFHENWDIRTSLIDAFATFFLLSNMKFLSVAFDLLAPVNVYHLSSTGETISSWRLYYNATLPYFGAAHRPYAILAISVLVLFTLMPVLLLILYPLRCFQKFLRVFPFRWYILHTFMDSFQGCFKDGTEPDSHDCRWFASLFFLTRFIALVIAAFTLNVLFFLFVSIVLVIMAILLTTVQPFKPAMAQYTYINTIFVLLLALFYVSLVGNTINEEIKSKNSMLFFSIAIFTAILPLLYTSVLSLCWLYSHRKFGAEVIRKLKAWRLGYEEV